MELWKDIGWTNGQYQVSNEGRIRSNADLIHRKNATVLKTHTDQKGYARVKVTCGGVSRTIKVHREVAVAFVDNPEHKPQVNHINGNKLDNRAENLEWVTNKENVYHAIQNGLWDEVFASTYKVNEQRKTPIVAISIHDGKETIYESMRDAERACHTRHINEVLDGKRKQANGYTFRREVI